VATTDRESLRYSAPACYGSSLGSNRVISHIKRVGRQAVSVGVSVLKIAFYDL
jgi:hypothetical protein